MKKIIIIVLVVVAGLWAWFNLTPTAIYVNDELIGVATNKIVAKKLVKSVTETKLKSTPEAMVSAEIKYKSSMEQKNENQVLIDKLDKKIEVQVPCTIVVVDGEAVVGLPTKDNAGEFLIKIKDKYKLPNCEEPEIKENITIDNSGICIDKFFKNVDDAVKFVIENKKITVITRKPINGEVVVPQKTVRVSSKQIPYGKSKVISKGKPGKKRVEGFAIYENGVKVREENTFEEYIVQPVPKQIATGI